VDCERAREAISALVDGEDPGVLRAALDAHVDRCPACRAWHDDVTALARTTRVAPADPVPDLTAAIMAGAPPNPAAVSVSTGRHGEPKSPKAARAAGGVRARHARLALTFVGFFQLGLALPALLFGADVAASLHVAHELASWEVALGVGFLVAAARPARAYGMVPLVAVLVACLLSTTAFDVVDGHAGAAESLHAVELLGLAFLWLLARATTTTSVPPRLRPA
jgi:predicted anti-sigma-YlaC factor YlaD